MIPRPSTHLTVALFAIVALAGCGGDEAASAPGEDVVADEGGAVDEGTATDTAADDEGGASVDTADAGEAASTDEGGEVDAAADATDTTDAADDGPAPLPRPGTGEPLSEAEITNFTKLVTRLWRDVDYFRWARMTSHGLAEGNEWGQFHYALWWQDTDTTKEGDVVTFSHRGRADNLTLRTAKVLTNTAAAVLLYGGEHEKWLTEQYSRGLAALSMATHFKADDVAPFLQARAIFTHDHEYETVRGRKVRISYEGMRRIDDAWNARNLPNPTNPHWGEIWLVNQRSKDDVPHMFRTVPMLMRVAADAPSASTREAAELALTTLRGFAKDIVDNGYQIRTKYEDGEPVVPVTESGAIKDLASFVLFEGAVPNAECNAKLGAALIAYDEPRDNDCEEGSGGAFDNIAPARHYFNYAIIRYFHIAAVANARVRGFDAIADRLLEGLAVRSDGILHDESKPHFGNDVWWSDAAAYLLAAGAAGLVLTHEEARLIHREYLASVGHYAVFPHWDPWSDNTPDGAFDYKPHRGTAVRPTEIAYLIEYCASELRHPDSAPLVDCDVVRDPARWGNEPAP